MPGRRIFLMMGLWAAGAVAQPPDPSLPYAWYRGETGLLTAADGSVTAWQNQATGGVTSNRDLGRVARDPRIVSLLSATGRLQAVRFGGDDALWATASAFGSLNESRTLLFALRLLSPADGFLFDGSTASGMTRARVRQGLWQAGIQPSPIANAGNDDPLAGGTAVTSVWEVHSFRFSAAGTNVTVEHALNFQTLTNFTQAATNGLGGLILGANVAQQSFLALDIGEALVLSNAVSDAALSNLQSYLVEKWTGAADPPMRLVSCTVTQSPRRVAPFGVHDLLDVRVETDGLLDPLAVTSMVFDLQGTEDPGALSSVTVFSTGLSPVFRAERVFACAAPATGTLAVAGFQSLEAGVNHFWIAAEASAPLAWGQHLDARLIALGLTGTNGMIAPADGDPPGDLVVDNQPFKTVLRRKGDDGVNTYRIPGLAVTTGGTLIAVFDARWDGSGDLPANIDIACRRSTDLGLTWSPMQIILDFDKAVPDSSGNGVGDPCVLVDRETGRVWVAGLWSFGSHAYYGSGPGRSTNETGQYVLSYSDDEGVSWSPPVNITAQAKVDTNWGACFQGPGNGIQLRDGALVFPSQYRDADGRAHSFLVFSTNHGAQWAVSPPANSYPPQCNESQAVELDDGRILLSMRDPNTANNLRTWSWLSYTGNLAAGTWSPLHLTNADPTCQATLVRYSSRGDGHPRSRLLFANPAHPSQRTNLTVRLSDDEGATWPAARLLEPRRAAYSCLATLPDGTIGILYESGDTSSIDELVFARFTLDWLTNAQLDSDGDGMSDYYEHLNNLQADVNDAPEDADGDGLSNLDEYRAGTSAGEFASVFQCDALSGGPSLAMRWRTVPWRHYLVAAAGAADAADWRPLLGPVAATGAVLTAVLPAADTQRLFRAEVLAP